MRLLDWILGREPVATATGLAGLVTALLGVAAAFGLDITAEQIAAIGAAAAAVAGFLSRKAVSPVTSPAEREAHRLLDRQAEMRRTDTGTDDSRFEGGGVPLALIILIAVGVILVAGIGVSCDALFEDEDEVDDVGLEQVAYHEEDEYGSDYSSEDRNRNRHRNRGAFSPGPFDDSPVDAFNGNTICLPGSTCNIDDRRRDEPPDEGGPQ